MMKTNNTIKLRKYIKPYLIFAILAPLWMGGEVAIDLVQPTFMSNIVEVGVVNNDISAVWYYGI